MKIFSFMGLFASAVLLQLVIAAVLSMVFSSSASFLIAVVLAWNIAGAACLWYATGGR